MNRSLAAYLVLGFLVCVGFAARSMVSRRESRANHESAPADAATLSEAPPALRDMISDTAKRKSEILPPLAGEWREPLSDARGLFAASHIEHRPDGTEQWHLTSPSRGECSVIVERSERSEGVGQQGRNSATVTIRNGRWAGTATLIRR